jgi:histone deacetylase 6
LKEYYEQLSLYINTTTPLCARLSAGGVIETALAVMNPASNIRNAFAIVRPPGHHAEPNEHMGFCFFNNVAVAARVVQQHLQRKVRMVIIDWSVHHRTSRLLIRSD